MTFYILLLAGLFLRIYLSQFGTFQSDVDYFIQWASLINHTGLDNFYDETWCDYMPLYLYILLLLQKISFYIPAEFHVTLFKIPAIISDLLISLLIYYYVKNKVNPKYAALSSLLYFYNPASISNSTLWGQIDAFHLFPVLLSVVLLTYNRYLVANVFLIISILIKPYSIILLPLYGLIYFFDVISRSDCNKTAYIKITRYISENIIVLSAIIILISYPFIKTELYQSSFINLFIEPFIFIKSRFELGFTTYPFTSVNAFNFWGLIDGMWNSDQRNFLFLTLQNWGTLIFAFMYTGILAGITNVFIKNKIRYLELKHVYLIYAVILIFFSLFLFVTRVHERHFLPVVIFLSLFTFLSRKYVYIYIFVSIFYCSNMLYAYYYDYVSLYSEFVPVFVVSCLIIMAILLYDYLITCIRSSLKSV